MADKIDTRTMLLGDNPWKLVMKLRIPTIIGMVVVGFYNFMDSVYVGRSLWPVVFPVSSIIR